jgi:predicted flap endonuclease-1-like 5' DNA nuclease
MRLVYTILAVFLLLCFFFTRWYLCSVRHLCEVSANLEIAIMILAGLAIGFAASWLMSENTFRVLRGQLGGMQKEKTVLHEQLRLLEKENQSARRHVAEWQQEGSLLSQVKKVTEPLLQQARHQVEILEQELKQYQRRYDNLKEETDSIRNTAEQLRNELAAERAREVALMAAVEVKREAEPQPVPQKTPKPQSRFTPSSWETKDDLTLISGIGPGIQKKLNQLGIYSFQQIAQFTPEDVDAVAAALKVFKGRIGRDNWIGQAAALRKK